MIRNAVPADHAALLDLWQKNATGQGYAPRPDAEVDRLLFSHPYFSYKHTFIREEQGRAVVFTCGCVGDDIPRGKERGYFTCLVAEPQWDTPETTAQLLNALEDSFRAAGRTASAVTFFNPMHLPWVLPGSPGHEHNNMPGIATDLPLHDRMLAHGYTEATQETAMYRTLADFAVPDTIRAQEQQAAAEGNRIALYDPARCHGLDAMLQALDNPDWTAQITEAGRTGALLPVALVGNTVAGFAGPIYPEPTGRGYFAGIGIAPQYQHRHLGKLLFFRLCEEEKKAGAAYMSLFSGITNPARRIYESAGFRSVRTFGVLLKTL